MKKFLIITLVVAFPLSVFGAIDTFNSVAGQNSPVDGATSRTGGGNETFTNIRTGSGDGNNDAAATIYSQLSAGTVSNTYTQLYRGEICFDTTSIGTNVVSSSTLSVWGNDRATDLTQSYNVTSATVANTANLANTDYDIANHGSTDFSTDVAGSSWPTSNWQHFTLNAAGRAHITGAVTCFSIRTSGDIDNVAPTWVSGANAYVGFYSADGVGGTKAPQLLVEHAPAVGGGSNSGAAVMMGMSF